MMKVVLAPDVEIAIRMLDPDGARRVQAWFSYLEHWDTDEVVRRNSPQLPEDRLAPSLWKPERNASRQPTPSLRS